MVTQTKKSTWIIVTLCVIACHNKKAADDEQDASPEQTQTPVTVTAVSNDPLTEYLELNATSVFQQDNIVKSSINGYITTVNTSLGESVTEGQVLFTLRTKEAESLGNTINELDSSFHFSGIVNIKVPKPGYVTELPHQKGDYVQDGEQLAVISNASSFGFVLNLPYELRRFVTINKPVEVLLPDSTELQGVVASFQPTIDSASQTQQVMIKVSAASRIPENLVVKVRIIKTQKANAISLPKQAVLSNDAQTSFWVMKMTDSSTAIRIPVEIGVQTADRIEITKPQFATGDKIILTGNYGLADTARVKIVKAE